MPVQNPAPPRAGRHRTPLADINNSKTKANRVTNLKCEVRHILQHDGVPHEAVEAIVKATGQMLNGKQCTAAAKRGAGFNSRHPKGLPGPSQSRAPADPPRELLLQNLAACHESKETWHGIKSTKQGYALYRDATKAVEKELLDGIVIAESRRGAFLDPNVVLPEYLALAEKSHILHGGSHPQALCIFLDAKKMYNDSDSQLLSFSLPYARNPHQLPLQLTVWRWLAKDSAFDIFSVFDKIHVCEALQLVIQRGVAFGLGPRLEGAMHHFQLGGSRR